MAEYFIDVSSYQPSSYAYFIDKKRRGAKGVVIKTSEGGYGGTPYVSQSGKTQIANARKAGLKIAVYHYAKFNSLRYGANDPVNEANLMANTARAWGCGKDTLMVLDAEDPVLRYDAAADAAIFYNALKRKGFKHFDIYGPGSWFWNGRLRIGTQFHLGGWPAAYGSSGSGVSGAKAWQYTDNWKGLGVDGSLDYGGQYTTTKESTPAKPKKMTNDNVHEYYFCYNPGRIITKTTIYQHTTGNLKSKSNRKLKLPAGTAVDIAAVHTFSNSVVPYFELANGTFITASREAVTNAYYEGLMKEIKVIKRITLYRDLQRSKVVKRKGFRTNSWPVGTPFTVKKVIPYKSVWVLKLDNGYYCTSYKQYVKKIK